MGAALAPVSLAASIGGSLFGAASSISNGDYQAQVASNNAAVARQNETYAYAAGAEQEQQNALNTRNTVGQEKASQASNGLDVNSGSNVAVRAGSAALGELSGLTIRNNAARAAAGYETEAQSDEAQSALDRSAGISGAVGSLIGGATGTTNLYGNLKRSGAILPGSFLDFGT